MSNQELSLSGIVTEHLQRFNDWKARDVGEQKFKYVTPADADEQLKKIAKLPLVVTLFEKGNQRKKSEVSEKK